MKMIKIISIAIIFCFSPKLFSQVDLDLATLKGHIKTYKYTQTSFDEKGEISELREKKYVLNEKGEILSFEDNLSGETLYKYDKNGNFQFSRNVTTPIESVKDYCLYNSENLLTEEATYDFNGDLYEKYKYFYDGNKNRVKAEQFKSYKGDNNVEKLRRRTEYSFNDNNLLVAEKHFEFDETIASYSTEYRYDEKNNRIEEKLSARFPDEYSQPHLIQMKYDVKGNLIEEIKYISINGNEKLEKSNTLFFTYDAKNQLTSRKRANEKDEMVLSEKFTYDDFGNLLSESLTGKESKNLTYQYTYDEKKNWITLKSFLEKNMISITNREISYW